MNGEPVFCIQCGKKNLAEARFCQYCGTPIPPGTEKNALTLNQEREELECPYCEQQMSVGADVTQLLCIQCAAAFEVQRESGETILAVLIFE